MLDQAGPAQAPDIRRDDAFWRRPLATLYQQTESGPAGLAGPEAARRLAVFGTNAIAAAPPQRLLWSIARRFAEPLVAILLAAAAISAATGDMASFAIIFIVITISIVLDVVQQHRAELAADALKRSVAIRSDTRRDGQFVSIPVEQIVPGDIVDLRAGDLVPADGVVIESRSAHVNEALMTGEPFPTEKRAGACQTDTPADAFNALFAGTSVVSGEAMMLVVATGNATRFGGISAALAASEAPSALERGIHRLGLLILRLTVFLVLFVLLVNLAFGHPALESFLFAVALAVGLTPELLPMIMTVTLSRGAVRMSQKSVIVKRLAAIHDLGAMDVLCTDKTGTLTQAHITLIDHTGANGDTDDRTLVLAAVNSRFSTGIRSPLDQAVLDRAPDNLTAAWTKLDEIPFDFERRSIAVLATNGHERILVVKGVPERILALSTSIDLGDGTTGALDEQRRAVLENEQERQAERGCRLLAVAWKPIPAGQAELRPEDECDLVFAGHCVFVDPPKSSSATAIGRLTAAGVRVKVISGDHDAVVRHVVTELGMSAENLLTGAEITRLSDAALAARVEETDLFARVSPDQKTRIIRALQARGHTVGFLGDGVNDAPAIRAAEIGISVEGATDVARSAADIILLAQNLEVVADGVEEGRRTFANILKYVRMGTSSNFGNMLSMALASLALPFLPLLPIQILLNNLLYDMSEVGIPFDSVDPQEITTPQAWNIAGILRFTLIMGALSSAFDIATFLVLIKLFHAAPDEFRTAWFVESMATQILVIFFIRTSGRFYASTASRMLIVTSFGALVLAMAIALTPLGAFFGFVGLPLALIAVVVFITAAYLLAAEMTKNVAARFARSVPARIR